MNWTFIGIENDFKDIRNFRAARSAYNTVYLDPELPTMVSTGAFIHDNPCDL